MPVNPRDCLLVTQSGLQRLEQPGRSCPFMEIERTSRSRSATSEHDPSATFGTRKKIRVYSIGGIVRTQATRALRSCSVILLK
jgi:hypothetical protein